MREPSRKVPAGPVPDAEAARETIRRVLEPDGRIELAYLFGSVARGTARSRSDVDVAVGFSEPEEPLERLHLRFELEERLGAAFRRPVDVVDLFRAPPILLHQILESGRPPALVRDEMRRLQFENWARKLYFDMKVRYAIYDRVAADAVRARLEARR